MSRARARRGRFLVALPVLLVALVAAAGTGAEVTATQNTIINFDSRIFPRLLPREGTAPVGIQISGHVRARKGREAAAMTLLELKINEAAGLSRRGLPVCDLALIDPASSAQAIAACPGAQIGYGRIHSHSSFPGSPHLQLDNRVTIFNGRMEDGKLAILLHVFNPKLHSSFVFPLTISHRRGQYGTVLTARVRVGRWSSVTAFNLVLNRTYRYRGEKRSFLNAGCPAPRGFSVGISPFVIATLKFADGTESEIPVVGSCRVTK